MPDQPRYLTRSGRTTNAPEDSDAARGYFDHPSRAMRHEPEPVDQETQRLPSL